MKPLDRSTVEKVPARRNWRAYKLTGDEVASVNFLSQPFDSVAQLKKGILAPIEQAIVNHILEEMVFDITPNPQNTRIRRTTFKREDIWR